MPATSRRSSASRPREVEAADRPRACPRESLDILDGSASRPTAPAMTVDVAVPSWRPDIDGKADLVEEVMRIHGVDNIAPQPLASHDAVSGKILTPLQIRTPGSQAGARRARHDGGRHLVVHPGAHAEAFGGGARNLKLANPIAADMSDMRPSLLPGLITAAQRNADRGHGDVGAVRGVGDLRGRSARRPAPRRCRRAPRHGAGRRRWPPLGRRCQAGRCVRRQGRCARRARGVRRAGRQAAGRGGRPLPGIIPAAPARSSSASERCWPFRRIPSR